MIQGMDGASEAYAKKLTVIKQPVTPVKTATATPAKTTSTVTTVSNKTPVTSGISNSTAGAAIKSPAPVVAPAFGSNVANFDATNQTQLALANAGQQWWDAKAKGDQAGMDAAATLGNQIRSGITNQQTSFDGNKGITTLGAPIGGDATGGAKGTDVNGMITDQLGQLDTLASNGRDAQISSSTAQINATRDQQIADLEKTYQDAVMNGKMSINEAQSAFEDQKKTIEAQAYSDSQATNLAGQNRGIQNSQQMLGLMQGDQAREQSLLNTNMTSRDRQVADINLRLQNLQTNRDLDVTNAVAQAGYKVTDATGQANSQYNQNMFNATDQKGNLALGYAHDTDMANLNQQFTQSNMATQQGYNQQNVATQQQYNKDNMSIQNGYSVKMAYLQDGFDQEKMKQAFTNTLEQMKKQYGYDSKLVSQKATADANAQANSAVDKMAEEEAAYQRDLKRTLAKYSVDSNGNPNTPEGVLAKKQMDEAHAIDMDTKFRAAVFDGSAKAILDGYEGTTAPVQPKGYATMSPNNPKKRDYDSKYDSYVRKMQFMSGKSNVDNLMSIDGKSPALYPGSVPEKKESLNPNAGTVIPFN